ncbi:nucleotidyltransferase domain-containing protein [Pseudomonas sp. C27(2019)]|uniref:type VII toxin-antitoxin system MntA family adenylyltransferase antitoxin n=1 Tax=Pseudomonas sp. C27(2019) TaxID=2604941 RepID=UPI001247567D|nr:nucleotidyltransferase domain-containing protein [Pseudomonas sp. C27(2019)]QEY59746.1 nucleotidyltransferase domain-containing protein [Pseudomonas sp. C27(2019)]
MNIINQCISFAQNDPDIAVLWLYGSQAKGTASAHSDYDFAIAFSVFKKDPWQQRLRPELLAEKWAEQLGVPSQKISIVDINQIPLPLAFSIISSGKVVLSKNTMRLIKEEQRISSMWEIDYQYHRRHYG